MRFLVASVSSDVISSGELTMLRSDRHRSSEKERSQSSRCKCINGLVRVLRNPMGVGGMRHFQAVYARW